MAFPTQPSVPLPTWATDPGAVKVDPGTTKRADGWVIAGPGLDYGEAPPFPWVNNEAYNNGQWATYFKAFADYIIAGNTSARYVFASQSTTLSLPVGVTNNLTFDTVSARNTSTSNFAGGYYFVAPVTDIYRIQVNIFIFLEFTVSSSVINDAQFILRINSTNYPPSTILNFKRDYLYGLPAGLYRDWRTYSNTLYLSLNAGDTVSFQFRSDSPTTTIFYADEIVGSNNLNSQFNISWNL